jgi:hypothetical protein
VQLGSSKMIAVGGEAVLPTPPLAASTAEALR